MKRCWRASNQEHAIVQTDRNQHLCNYRRFDALTVALFISLMSLKTQIAHRLNSLHLDNIQTLNTFFKTPFHHHYISNLKNLRMKNLRM